MATRRTFVKKAGTGLLMAGIPASFTNQQFCGKPYTLFSKHEDKFKTGMAGFTFYKFNIDQALDMMQKVDVRYLCIKDFHLPLDSTDAEIAAFHAKLALKNVTGYAVGPIGMETKEQADKAFAYAKRVGVNLIIGIPSVEILSYVDTKVREYDFRYAIHNHGPDTKLFPDASDIMAHVKELDRRIGICLDIGHDARYGADPVADLKKYRDRIFDIHLKDVTAPTKAGGSCEVGRGIINIPAFVKALRETKYSGVCSLEHEKNMDDPLAGIAESIGYFRGVIEGTRS